MKPFRSRINSCCSFPFAFNEVRQQLIFRPHLRASINQPIKLINRWLWRQRFIIRTNSLRQKRRRRRRRRWRRWLVTTVSIWRWWGQWQRWALLLVMPLLAMMTRFLFLFTFLTSSSSTGTCRFLSSWSRFFFFFFSFSLLSLSSSSLLEDFLWCFLSDFFLCDVEYSGSFSCQEYKYDFFWIYTES